MNKIIKHKKAVQILMTFQINIFDLIFPNCDEKIIVAKHFNSIKIFW